MAENPTSYFPDYFFQWDMKRVRKHRTETVEFRSGRMVRRAVYDPAGYERWSASTGPLSQAQREAVADFFDLRRGSYEPFWFFRPAPEQETDFLVGTVSGATSLVMPLKGPWFLGRTPVASSITTVKVGATLGGALTVSFSLTPNVGAGGEERVNFTGGPQTGSVWVSGMWIRRRLVTIFEDDELETGYMADGADAQGIAMVKVREVY